MLRLAAALAVALTLLQAGAASAQTPPASPSTTPTAPSTLAPATPAPSPTTLPAVPSPTPAAPTATPSPDPLDPRRLIVPAAELGPYWTVASASLPVADPPTGPALLVTYDNLVAYAHRSATFSVGVFRTPAQAQASLAAQLIQLRQRGVEPDEFPTFGDGAVLFSQGAPGTVTFGVAFTEGPAAVVVQVAGAVGSREAAYDLLRRSKQYAARQQQRVRAALAGATDLTAPFCAAGEMPELRFGFELLRREAGDVMGEAIECEHTDLATGHATQRTTRGVSTFHPSTGITHFTTGNEHVALGDFGVAEWQGPSPEPPPGAIVLALNRRGLQRWQAHSFQGALDDFTRALDVAPTFGPGYNNRALVHVALGDYDRALEDAEAAVFMGGEQGLPFTLATRAYVKYKRGEYASALADFDASVDLRDPAAAVYLGRGLTRLALGDHDGAREDLDAGLRLAENLQPDPELDDLVPAARAARLSLDASRP